MNGCESCTDDYGVAIGEEYSRTITVESHVFHSYWIERAIQNAMQNTHMSRTMIFTASLLGRFNLVEYFDNFSKEDIDWVHDRLAEAIVERDRKRAVKNEADNAEKIGLKIVEEAKALKNGLK